jgi:hypothetical protein
MTTRAFNRTPGSAVMVLLVTVLLAACSSPDNTPTRYATTSAPRTSSKPASAVAGQPTAQAPAAASNTDGGEQMPLGDGLQASTAGLTFTPSTTTLAPDAATAFSFRIIGPDGKAFTTFHPEQTQLMHLYLIRSDLTGFQHLHPTMASDGTWTASVGPLQPGTYRAYVAFVAVSSSGDTASLVLGDKITVTGSSAVVGLPAPATTTQVDGYALAMVGTPLTAGSTGSVTFLVKKAGLLVTDLEPYMGSFGQLTAVHEGDLALTYPLAQGDAKTGLGGPSLSFTAAPAKAGNWRMFIQFQTGGTVHTAAITVTVQ